MPQKHESIRLLTFSKNADKVCIIGFDVVH